MLATTYEKKQEEALTPKLITLKIIIRVIEVFRFAGDITQP
jgi:hypothetical protein